MAAKTENPSSIRVRKLEPWVIKTHSRIAQQSGVSLEEYLRRLLTAQALQSQKELAEELAHHRQLIEKDFGTNFPKGEELIRAVREDS